MENEKNVWIKIPDKLKKQMVHAGINVIHVEAKIKNEDVGVLKEIIVYVNKLQAKVDRLRASNHIIEKEINSNKRALDCSNDEYAEGPNRKRTQLPNVGGLEASAWADDDIVMDPPVQRLKDRIVAGVRTPGRLPPGPKIITDPSPTTMGNVAIKPAMHSANSPDDDDDYNHQQGRWLTPLEIRNRALAREREARNGKKASLEVVGRIPDLFGVVLSAHKNPQRNNYLHGMPNVNGYFSVRTNAVFVRTTATSAELWERTHPTGYRPNPQNVIYAAVPLGFPRNPLEVNELVNFTQGRPTNYPPWLRIEAYTLLEEFRKIAIAVSNDNQDRAMKHAVALKRTAYVPDVSERHWTTIPAPIDPKRLDGLTRDVKRESVKIPPLDRILDIDSLANYIAHYARPGAPNMIIGSIADMTLRVDRRATFGIGLLRIIRPSDRETHGTFTRHYAILVAHSHRYQEAIDRYNTENPVKPFKLQRGPPFKFVRADVTMANVGNFTTDDVARVLIENGVPPEWVSHAYNFGYQYFNQKYNRTLMDDDLWAEVDNERLRRIEEFGKPAAIPEWAGWRYPSEDDRIRIKMIIDQEMCMTPPILSLRHPAWLKAGQSPTLLYLARRPKEAVKEFVERQAAIMATSPAAPMVAAKVANMADQGASDANAALEKLALELKILDKKDKMLDYGTDDGKDNAHEMNTDEH